MIATREATSSEEHVSERMEIGGEIRFLSRLLAAPPDITLILDAELAGLIEQPFPHQIEELQVEYTRLFSAPGPEAVPAHQSIYTDALQIEPAANGPADCGMSFPGGSFHGYLGGKTCSEVSQWYAQTGFVPSSEFPQMLDHISTELDFLAYLYLMEATATTESTQEEADNWHQLRDSFRAAFIDRWVPLFADRLVSSKVSAFYRRIGKCLRELLSEPLSTAGTPLQLRTFPVSPR